jgi:protein disulfide-isomerase
MRLSPFALLAGVSALARAQSLDKDAVPNKENTVFNGISVPPLLELTPATFDAELKRSKFMMVKHYRYPAPGETDVSLV